MKDYLASLEEKLEVFLFYTRLHRSLVTHTCVIVYSNIFSLEFLVNHDLV